MAPSDREREQAALALQVACGEGRLTLEEFTDRVGLVWSAETSDGLERATADLAPATVSSSQRPPTRRAKFMVNILGDTRRSGRWRVPRQSVLVSILGDWKLDFRGALVSQTAIQDGCVDLTFVSALGDLKITVPEGVEVELSGFCLLGDEKIDLAAGPLLPGAPKLRIKVFGLLGNVLVRSAPTRG